MSVRVPIGAVTAVAGAAGAGKASLAFDVLYAEGHRRYAETFSPYARQFLERLERPRAERIEGVLPRALYARSATLCCRVCGEPVRRDTASSVFEAVVADAAGRSALVTFPHRVGIKVGKAVLRGAFEEAGLRRVLERGETVRVEDAECDPRTA